MGVNGRCKRCKNRERIGGRWKEYGLDGALGSLLIVVVVVVACARCVPVESFVVRLAALLTLLTLLFLFLLLSLILQLLLKLCFNVVCFRSVERKPLEQRFALPP